MDRVGGGEEGREVWMLAEEGGEYVYAAGYGQDVVEGWGVVVIVVGRGILVGRGVGGDHGHDRSLGSWLTEVIGEEKLAR